MGRIPRRRLVIESEVYFLIMASTSSPAMQSTALRTAFATASPVFSSPSTRSNHALVTALSNRFAAISATSFLLTEPIGSALPKATFPSFLSVNSPVLSTIPRKVFNLCKRAMAVTHSSIVNLTTFSSCSKRFFPVRAASFHHGAGRRRL